MCKIYEYEQLNGRAPWQEDRLATSMSPSTSPSSSLTSSVVPLPSQSPLASAASAMHRLSNASSSAICHVATKVTKPALKRGAHTEVKFSNHGRASILKGVDVLANAVSVILGPKGACAAPLVYGVGQ